MKWYKRKGRGRSAGRVRITPIFAFPPTGSHHNTTHIYSRPSSRRHNCLFWPRVEKSCRLGRPNRSYYLLLLLLLLLMLTPMLFRTSRDRERVIIKSIGRIIVCVYSVRALPYTTTSSTSCRPVRGGVVVIGFVRWLDRRQKYRDHRRVGLWIERQKYNSFGSFPIASVDFQ